MWKTPDYKEKVTLKFYHIDFSDTKNIVIKIFLTPPKVAIFYLPLNFTEDPGNQSSNTY